MADNWSAVMLGDHSTWASGGTPPKDGAEFWNGEIPWISASSMKTGRLASSDRMLTSKGLERGSRLAAKGSILLLVRGSELHKRVPVGIATRDVAFNQDVKAINVNGPLSNEYLYYWLIAHEPMLLAKVEPTGIGAGKLDTDILKALRISVPKNPKVRDHIVNVAKSLDDKIELNWRMAVMLEEMAQAVFKSWFIDFDPVRAKAEGRPTNLPPEIDALFPDFLEDSELGPIPKGWKIGCVDDDFALTMGQSPPGSTYNQNGEGLPFYQGRSDFGFRFPTHRVYCTAPNRLAKAGDTLISVRAPVGDINMADEVCAIGRGVAAARHRTGSRSYTYYFMRSIEAVFDKFESEGTVFGSIGKKDFHAIKCCLPPRGLVEYFERIVGPLDEKVGVVERETSILATIRDSLLPKLTTGEITVQTELSEGQP